MALAEIARLWNLAEARVVQSALEAAGFQTVLFDENRASVLWTEQLAIGGLRLMTADTEAVEARAFLQALRAPPEIAPPAPGPAGFFNPRSIIGLLVCWVFGWSLAGLRLDRGRRIAALVLMGVTVAGLAAIFSRWL